MPVVGAVCVPLAETGSVGWLPNRSESCADGWSLPSERNRTVPLDATSSHQELSFSYPELRQSLLVPVPQSHCDPLCCPRASGPSQELEGAETSHASRGIRPLARALTHRALEGAKTSHASRGIRPLARAHTHRAGTITNHPVPPITARHLHAQIQAPAEPSPESPSPPRFQH